MRVDGKCRHCPLPHTHTTLAMLKYFKHIEWFEWNGWNKNLQIKQHPHTHRIHGKNAIRNTIRHSIGAIRCCSVSSIVNFISLMPEQIIIAMNVDAALVSDVVSGTVCYHGKCASINFRFEENWTFRWAFAFLHFRRLPVNRIRNFLKTASDRKRKAEKKSEF